MGTADTVPAGVVTFKLEIREGPTIRVLGTADGLEYLRFDCFPTGPHYHYRYPGEKPDVIREMDPVAFGDPWTWTLGRLGTRLPQMLTEAGGAGLAAAVDPAAVAVALDQVAELRRSLEGQRVR